MTGKHHLIAGTVTGACLATSAVVAGNANYLIVGGAVLTTMIGSLFPDIDSSTSKLGSKMKITSTIINKLFGHRGFLHSPLLCDFSSRNAESHFCVTWGYSYTLYFCSVK